MVRVFVVLVCTFICKETLALSSKHVDSYEREYECPVNLPFTLEKRKLGVVASGINLTTDLYEGLVDRIKEAVYEHKIIVFKHQGLLEEKQHTEIASLLGPLAGRQPRHKKAQANYVFRVSNDPKEGIPRAGNRGWHLDNYFTAAPFELVTYHMLRVADNSKGHTLFIDFEEMVKSLTPERRSYWERVYIRCKDMPGIVHPLIYPHPVTHKPVLCFHMDFIDRVILDYKSSVPITLGKEETDKFAKEIITTIERDNKAHIHHHVWEQGDFIISDNRAVGHLADEDTKLPPSEIGLRVLQRIGIQGTHVPVKELN